MIDLTNKDILAIYLSLKDSQDIMTKGLKGSNLTFDYEEQMAKLDGDKQRLETIQKVKDLVIGAGKKKLDLINSIAGKFKPIADFIVESDTELYDEVSKLLYDKDVDDELKSILKV